MPNFRPLKSEKGLAHMSMILVGVLVFGLAAVAAVLILKPGLLFDQNKPQPVAVQKTPAAPQLTLTLDGPLDQTLVSAEKITVTGKTTPNTTVAFYDEADANSVTSDSSGKFTGDLALADGINTIIVSAFDGNGNDKTQTVNLVFDKTGGK
jgi:hypothetical protein